MSETGFAAVMFMVLAVMIVVSYWRQIAVLMLYVAAIAFCFGVYHIVSIITYMI
jgi:hypothetical protein